MKKILSLARQAIQTYNMIENGDRIAVGVSGGKDSLVMLEALKTLGTFYTNTFETVAISIDNGFESTDYKAISDYCQSRGIEHIIIKTHIKEIAFDNLRDKTPCSLCSRMRRAALCETALKYRCNKLALGHNKNDAIETYIMNLIYNANPICFEPVTCYEDKKITIIRPLVFASEYDISKCAINLELPVMERICPFDGKTGREDIKKLISALKKQYRYADKNIFTAIKNSAEFKKYETEKSHETDGLRS